MEIFCCLAALIFILFLSISVAFVSSVMYVFMSVFFQVILKRVNTLKSHFMSFWSQLQINPYKLGLNIFFNILRVLFISLCLLPFFSFATFWEHFFHYLEEERTFLILFFSDAIFFTLQTKISSMCCSSIRLTQVFTIFCQYITKITFGTQMILKLYSVMLFGGSKLYFVLKCKIKTKSKVFPWKNAHKIGSDTLNSDSVLSK